MITTVTSEVKNIKIENMLLPTNTVNSFRTVYAKWSIVNINHLNTKLIVESC